MSVGETCTAPHWRGMTFSRDRLIVVAVIVVLVAVGFALPYLSLEYLNNASELIRPTERLSGAASLLGGLDPTYLPGYDPQQRDKYTLALNVMGAAPGVQQAAGVVAAIACLGLFSDEVNKFFWWPLNFAGYPLVLTPIPLFVGLHLERDAGMSVSLGPGWVVAPLVGVLALVASFTSRSRLDTYAGI